MPRIEEPVVVPNYALTDALAWISKFAHAWKAIEPAPATLSIDGFIIWGPVLYEKYSGEDPVKLAARLFGHPGPYFRYLYPGAAAAANQAWGAVARAPAPWLAGLQMTRVSTVREYRRMAG